MQGGAAAPHLTKPTTQPCAAIPEVIYDLFQLPPCQQTIRLDTVLTGGRYTAWKTVSYPPVICIAARHLTARVALPALQDSQRLRVCRKQFASSLPYQFPGAKKFQTLLRPSQDHGTQPSRPPARQSSNPPVLQAFLAL